MTSHESSSASCELSHRVALLAGMLLAPGCQLVFGTYNAGISGDGSDASTASGGTTAGHTQAQGGTSLGGATGTGGTTDWGTCDGQQTFNCRGLIILQCVSGKWTPHATCTKDVFCNPQTGICDTCERDTYACGSTASGGTAVLVCAEPQTGFTTSEICTDGKYCAPGASVCVACESGEQHCIKDDAGAYTQAARCNSDRSGWDTRNCKGVCTIVDGTKDVCPECTTGETACQTTTAGKQILRTCNNGNWDAKPCDSDCIQPSTTTPAACL